jgi:hypothetical protein
MNRLWAPTLLAITSLTLSCGGGGNNRQLQSITISRVVNGQQIQFSATGTFSSAPTTVSPLAVSWSYAPPPGRYSLTTQPFLFDCEQPESPGPIVAMAPADPSAPSSGSMKSTQMITTSGPIPCH